MGLVLRLPAPTPSCGRLIARLHACVCVRPAPCRPPAAASSASRLLRHWQAAHASLCSSVQVWSNSRSAGRRTTDGELFGSCSALPRALVALAGTQAGRQSVVVGPRTHLRMASLAWANLRLAPSASCWSRTLARLDSRSSSLLLTPLGLKQDMAGQPQATWRPGDLVECDHYSFPHTRSRTHAPTHAQH